MLQVAGQPARGLVPSTAVLLQALEDDPVQLAAHQRYQLLRIRAAHVGDARQRPRLRELRARPRRLDLPDHPQHLQEPGRLQLLPRERHAAGQELVEDRPQGVDVGAGVDVEIVQLRLLRRHVFQRADQRADLGVDAPIGQPRAGGLGDAEVDHLGHRPAVVEGDQDVRRLQVAVDHALLVGVLHRLADRHEQRQPLAGDSRARSQYSVIGTPLISSITK